MDELNFYTYDDANTYADLGKYPTGTVIRWKLQECTEPGHFDTDYLKRLLKARARTAATAVTVVDEFVIDGRLQQNITRKYAYVHLYPCITTGICCSVLRGRDGTRRVVSLRRVSDDGTENEEGPAKARVSKAALPTNTVIPRFIRGNGALSA